MSFHEDEARYRDMAADMRKMSKKARTERAKEEFLAVASQYEKLADEVARLRSRR